MTSASKKSSFAIKAKNEMSAERLIKAERAE
jgi:hypothetical protein